MHAAADRPEFAPPPQPGLVRAFVLAVIAHLLLVLALTHGLQWQRESENAVAEAELWSTLPREAAPREQPAPRPAPTPPVEKTPPKPDPQLQREADIALEREKQRRAEEEKEKQRLAELEKKREQERRRLEAEKKREEELARRKEEEARKVAEAKRKDQERKQREEREAKRREELRKEQLARVQAMAGTGAPDATGNSTQSAGPSASWGAKVQAKVRPNIVFTDVASGNPKADVEVKMSPDGTIVGKRLVRSSGNKAWDEAVLRALDRTGSLPRDVDGRVPSTVTIGFRPHD